MTLCPYCGISMVEGICYAHTIRSDSWAKMNRIVCDGLHRGKWPETRVEVGARQVEDSDAEASTAMPAIPEEERGAE